MKRNAEEIIDKRTSQRVFVYTAILLIIALVALRGHDVSCVPTSSMSPTIGTGSIIYATKDVGEPKRYDIYSFYSEELDEILIKRVIGLPGEQIVIKDGKVYADGAELVDEFIKEPMEEEEEGELTFDVPEGCYFFMGDNRNESFDSRYWKDPFVPREKILTKTERIIFPFWRMKRIVNDY